MSISLQVQSQQIFTFFYQQILLKGLTASSAIKDWIDEWINQLSAVDQLILFEIISEMDNQDQREDQKQVDFKAIKQKCLTQKSIIQAVDLPESDLSAIIDQIAKHLIERSKNPNQLSSNQISLRSVLLQMMIVAKKQEQDQDSVRSQWPQIPWFEIKAYLGEGQIAKAYLAINQSLPIDQADQAISSRLCVLKVGLVVDPMRFEQEITLMKQISHPNVMPCFDAAQFDDQGIRKFWISMPNLIGWHLEDLILKGVLDLNMKIFALSKVLDGLCALHEKGIIHRDLKPGNCLISAEGEILLSNFGLSAHQLSNVNAQITQTHSFNLIGTPAYMSPEQTKDQRDLISFQSDVWAFGIMMYETLVGDLPWGRSINSFEMLGNIQHLPIPMEKFNELGFPKMKMVLYRCLNRDIQQRFPHAMALKEAFIKAYQEDLHIIMQNRKDKTCQELKAKKVFEQYFKNCLLEGKSLRILEFVKMIREINQKMDWDWEEIYQRFDLGEQWVNGWYSWQDDYLKKIGEMQGRLQSIEVIKEQAMKALMDLFKEKMLQIPSDKLHLRIGELQTWQKQEMDLIEDKYLQEKLAIEGGVLADRQRIEEMVIGVEGIVWGKKLRDESEKLGIDEQEQLLEKAKLKRNQTIWPKHLIVWFCILGGLVWLIKIITDNIENANRVAREIVRKNEEQRVIAKFRESLILIKGGSFMMGSKDKVAEDHERPMHRVEVRDFYMSKTEVTLGQYRKCVEAGVCSKPNYCDFKLTPNWTDQVADKENHPINCVDWKQARSFAKWVGGDLPSEAQWEYAARSGGRDITYPWGNAEATCKYAVMREEKKDDGCGEFSSWAVCSKTEGNTTQGLCDMGGNLWEWVLDEWHHSYSGAPTNDMGWCSDRECERDTSVYRVYRGGSLNRNASYLRSTSRDDASHDDRRYNIGFRVSFKYPLSVP